MCLKMIEDDNCKLTKGKSCKLSVAQCLAPTGWYYNRFTKRIEAQEVTTGKGEVVQKCLSRQKVKSGTMPIILAADCDDEAHQVWEYQCQAFTYLQDAGKKTETIRVLQANKKDKSISVDKYYADPEQLWYLHEVVRHSRCRTKRYKVMKFRGTLSTTVVLKNFVAMPESAVTVQFWMKGEAGTPFSYASDGIPAPPYRTQLAINIPKKDGPMTIDLFDVEFKTGVHVPQHKWVNVAVSWDTTFGQLKMYHDGKLVWTKNTQAEKSATGKPSFAKSKFVASGCLMLGQKAKRPCKQRIAASSFKGEITDLLVHRGVLNRAAIEEAMFKPVDPVYLATITEEFPTNKPNLKNTKLAWLTRMYGSQEMNSEYPPVCQLRAESKISMTNQEGGGPNFAKLCEQKEGARYTADNPLRPGHKLTKKDCYMTFFGQGDVHYHTFGGCYWDDQSVGAYVAVTMKPDYYKLHPLMIQYMNSPYQSEAPWAQKMYKTINGRKVRLPGMLSFVDGCAIKFKGERFAIGFGGYHYNFGGERSKFTPYADFTNVKGETKEVCPPGRSTSFHATCQNIANCVKSKYFSGNCRGRSSATINMQDGLQMRCWHGGLKFRVPRKLENKIMGMGGSQAKSAFYKNGGHSRSRNNVQTTSEWTVGLNAGNVHALNEKWNSKTLKQFLVKGRINDRGSANQVSKYDMEPMVVGKQIAGLRHPQDGQYGGSCRPKYQYPYTGSPYNGNRPFKGVAKMMSSWYVDDDHIPSIFGGVDKKVAKNKWWELTPAFGISKNKPKGAKELAQKACQSLKAFKKSFADCVFDFIALGPKAVKRNLKSRATLRAGRSKKPTLKSVRDATGGNNHGVWVGHPSWGCVDEFSVHVTALAKAHMAAKFRNKKKASMCKCQHKYLGVCAYDHFICIADVELDNKPKKQLI